MDDPNRRLGMPVLLLVIAIGMPGCLFKDNSRRLMPTPLGIVAGLPYPGGGFDHLPETGSEVPVFVISGRNVVPDKDGPDPFGTERSRQPTLGVAWVKIGEGLTTEELLEETVTDREKKKAKVEFSRIEISPNLENTSPWRVKDEEIRHRDNPWVQSLKQQLDETGNRNVTIFVHGYNTEFIENTLLAAEIYHYLGRQGAMVSFEWPSESRLLGYIADKGNANFSTRHFRALLSNLAKETDAESITIVAHSAGSPIVVNALREIRLLEYDMTAEALQDKYRIRRVVLAAPDMDMMAFVNAVHDRFYQVAGGVAVYASPDDKALKLSQVLYGNTRLGRAVGKLQPWESRVLRGVPEIEMVDASVAENMYRNFLGHGYFHRDPWVSSDIGAFILGSDPDLRGLVKRDDEVFWRFPKDFPRQLERIAAESGSTRMAESPDAPAGPLKPINVR